MLTDMIETWSSTSFILVSMSTGMLYIMYISHQMQEHSNDNHAFISPNVTFNNFSTSARWICQLAIIISYPTSGSGLIVF